MLKQENVLFIANKTTTITVNFGACMQTKDTLDQSAKCNGIISTAPLCLKTGPYLGEGGHWASPSPLRSSICYSWTESVILPKAENILGEIVIKKEIKDIPVDNTKLPV